MQQRECQGAESDERQHDVRIGIEPQQVGQQDQANLHHIYDEHGLPVREAQGKQSVVQMISVGGER